MGKAIVAMLVAAVLSGCDTNAQPAQWPSVRQQRDPASDRVWRLTREGVSLYAAGQRQAVISLPGWIWVDEPYSCPPDVAIGPKGEALVTSNVVPTLWKIDPTTLAVTVHALKLSADDDKDIGFTGLAYSAHRGAFFAVSDTYGSTWRIDAELTRATKVASGPPRPYRMARSGHPRSAPCGDIAWRLSQLAFGN